MKVQEWMTIYYNACHVLKQFKIDDFVKLFIKNLKLKCQKLSSHWIELFRVLKQIDEQIYRLVLSMKYACLHSVFSIQLLEDYHWHHDDAELMIMPDLEDFQNEWDVKEVRDKWWIKSTIHYLVKWAGWSFKYNSYEPASHLAGAPKAVSNYKCKLKHKHKKVQISNMNKDSDFKAMIISHKQQK